MNYLQGTYPHTGNEEIIALVEALKRDIRETDTRTLLLLSKMIPPLETSISFQRSRYTSSEEVSDDDPGVDDNSSGSYPRHTKPKSPRGLQI